MTARHSGSGPSIRFDLPAVPGTYILVLRLHWECIIDAGALGEITFPPGLWLYCGSARGPGGLSARIAHHARFSDRPRWHIDHLRFAGTPVEVWYAISDDSIECVWASLLSSIEGVEEGTGGFGSSDCGCTTHLFRADSLDIFERFRELAGDVRCAAAVRLDG